MASGPRLLAHLARSFRCPSSRKLLAYWWVTTALILYWLRSFKLIQKLSEIGCVTYLVGMWRLWVHLSVDRMLALWWIGLWVGLHCWLLGWQTSAGEFRMGIYAAIKLCCSRSCVQARRLYPIHVSSCSSCALLPVDIGSNIYLHKVFGIALTGMDDVGHGCVLCKTERHWQ